MADEKCEEGKLLPVVCVVRSLEKCAPNLPRSLVPVRMYLTFGRVYFTSKCSVWNPAHMTYTSPRCGRHKNRTSYVNHTTQGVIYRIHGYILNHTRVRYTVYGLRM